ncbi:MAG: hypothetical protein N2487_02875 [Verrucomicrobiae bacterium]|nr:hypothetical protein [Verrucomicrobiae bacterium]
MEKREQQTGIQISGRVVIAIVIVALLIAGVIGGYAYITTNPSPKIVKWKLQRYLKNQALKKSFKTDFPFPSEKELSTIPEVLRPSASVTNPVGKLTKKDFQTLRTELDNLSNSNKAVRAEIANLQKTLDEKKAEYSKLKADTNQTQNISEQLKTLDATIANIQSQIAEKRKVIDAISKEIDPYSQDFKELRDQLNTYQQQVQLAMNLNPTNSFVVAFTNFIKETRGKLNQAQTYRAMYGVIGEELWVADKLLESAHPGYRKYGLSIARQAALDSQNYAENYWLAAKIYEAYLMPNIQDATDTNWKMPLSMENVLNESVQAFKNVEETNNVIRAYQTFIDKVGGSARADWSRLQIALIHEQFGDYKEAIKYLKEIQNTNNFAAHIKRIPALEAKLKEQPKKQ